MQPGLDAIKSNWRAILFIQIIAVAFVFLYYQVPALQTLPAKVDELKARYGVFFLFVSIWTVSIVVPEIAKLITRQKEHKLTARDFAFLAVYYALLGLFLENFYILLTQFIGTGTDLKTVIIKIAIDQLVMSVFFTMPYVTSFFLWRDSGYNFAQMQERVRQGEFWQRYFPTLITCWMYFGPMTIVIYTLPTALNYPVSMAANAAWSLIMVAMGTRKPTT